MINEHNGNVLDVESGIIVHGCNSHGVMGSGIAKEIRARWPAVYDIYHAEYQKYRAYGEPGLPLGSITWLQIGPDKYIVNAVTQLDAGRDPNVIYVDYDALREAFVMASRLQYVIKGAHLPFHFPLIGCGLANGDWGIVSKIIDEVLDGVEKNLWLFTP